MPEHTWTDPMPGYTELRIGGNVRGYVEHRTRLAFWNFGGRQRRSFTAIATCGTHATVEAAKAALEAYADAKDAICDGRRGIPGEHTGCHPSRCKTEG